ncbi:MAG: cation-translocating P-type ATPase [Cryobacterium sp.]|nr:cation-translocating P-type ATPase [Oligoflexia bacterium]
MSKQMPDAKRKPIETGLSAEDANLRHEEGKNELTHQKTSSPPRIFIRQFSGPLILILLVACVISLFLREWTDAAAIIVILILNATIGFFQEYQAERSVDALKDMTAPRALVIRDSKTASILATDVVSGDILKFESGDIIAADARLLEATYLKVNEAVLTGESLPVSKNALTAGASAGDLSREQMVFMGTAVATGTAIAEVVAIGMKTELGKIAALLTQTVSPLTPLQVQMKKMGMKLLWICGGVTVLVFILGWAHHRPLFELVIFSVSLAVAVVPEGLPAIITVALSLGVRRLAACHAIIRSLPSVETLGGVSVICTDKTGTLTTGKMKVREIQGKDVKEILRVAEGCCDAQLPDAGDIGTGDPTEVAILLAARKQGMELPEIDAENPRVFTHPFDPKRKRMSILRADGSLYVKGALETILPLCLTTEADQLSLLKINEGMASRGLRVLAVAMGKGKEEKELTYLGMIGIADPPREEAKVAIAAARAAGVKVVMITGDHLDTARAIALELGILKEGESASECVYARSTPEDKLRIIDHLKSSGEIVAMTGDGVNDAPALRAAHIGIAMGKGGTEVTRQAADLILADDNFSTIITAIREGRGIYANIRRAILYLLAGNFGELFVVLGASIGNLPLPFLAVHLLWINLVTDSLPALALITEPTSPDSMKLPPRSPKKLMVGKAEWIRIGWVGLLEGSCVLGLFLFTLKTEGLVPARNIAFTTLVLSQLWRAFSARSKSKLIFKLGFTSNRWVFGVVLFTLSIQIALHFVPLSQRIFGLSELGWKTLLEILIVSFITATVLEVQKLIRSQGGSFNSLRG